MKKEKLDIAASTLPSWDTVTVARPSKEVTKAKIQELIKEETRMVKGIFQCFETPGASVTISIRKYPGIPPFKMTMRDGETYEIPLYVARFLNGVDVSAGALGDQNKANKLIGTCSYAVHGFKWDKGQEAPRGLEAAYENLPSVVPVVGVSKRVKRYGFQSLEFGGVIE